MSIESPPSPDGKLKFGSKEQIEGRVSQLLKHKYGRGIYVHDQHETSAGDLVLTLGNSVPRNISDKKSEKNILKFVNVHNVFDIQAERTEGHYLIELPDRDSVYGGFEERQDEILSQLDWSMAKAIYENVFDLPPVRNQLNSIIQILRWTREEPGITTNRINDTQRSNNTKEYLGVLEELGFLKIKDGEVYSGQKLKSADLQRKSGDAFVKAAIGNVVQEGYHILRDELDLRMLSHYPKFANAYYYDAIQLNDPELWLDIDTIQENLKEQWLTHKDELVIADKLRELDRAGVLEKDGEYVRSDSDVFKTVSQEAPVA
jgi:hypothetical protein